MLVMIAMMACSDKDAPIDSTPVLTDTGEVTGPAPPCSGGTWGAITADPAQAVHVRANGVDTGVGTVDDPVATLDRAYQLAQDKARPIAVGPGTFPTALNLFGTPDGLSIQGCGVAETTLTGDDTNPVIDTNGASDLSLSGFAVTGGNIGIKVWGNSTDVTLTDLLIDGSTAAGISLNGGVCIVGDVQIVGINTSEDGFAYGLATEGAQVTVTNLTVTDATSAGIVAAGGSIALTNVSVTNTASKADGTLGRGIQLQKFAAATVESVTLDGNADAGLYALESAVTGSNLAILNTASAVCDGCSLETGDAAVFSRGDSTTDPSAFNVDLTDITIDSADRTGMLFSGVTANLGTITAQDCNHVVDGKALLAQDGAVVTGADFATLEESLDTHIIELPMPQ